TGPSFPTTRRSSERPAPGSTSRPRTTPGSGGPTRTPTGCSGSTSPSGAAWRGSPRTTVIGSRRNSTTGRGNGSATAPRRNAMPDDAQRCTSKLISNGDARKTDLWSDIFVHAVLPNDDLVRIDVKRLAQALVDVMRKDEGCSQLAVV